MLSKGFTIGADPEVFIINQDSRKAVLPYGITSGTKRKPEVIDGDITLQEDGFAIEYGFKPKRSVHDFCHSVSNGLRIIQEKAKDINGTVSYDPFIEISEDTMKAAKKKTVILGCLPDFNLNMEMCVPDTQGIAPEHLYFRTAGGHVHLGFPMDGVTFKSIDHLSLCVKVVKKFLGHKSIAMTLSALDSDEMERKRLTLYGGNGMFRPKPYGVEIRRLSNFWVFDADETGMIFDAWADIHKDI